MCNCIEDMHEMLKQKIQDKFSKPKKPVSGFYISTTLSGRAVVNIGISLENQIKQEQSFLVAEYCPWCGVKYEVKS